MKAFLAGIIAWCSIFATSTPAVAQDRGAVRSVQLISMSGAPGQSASSSPSGESAGQDTVEGQPVAADAFAVHDLQRRWVEFQMANRFSTAGGQSGDPDARVVPAAAASRDALADLPIPEWMRGGAYMSAPAPAGRECDRVPYQPTGFLASGAETRRATYYGMMSDAACAHGIPVGLFDAMIIQESRYNAGAVSPKNAFGLTQLMPDTALGLGVDRFNSAENLSGGARYLRQQIDRFGQFRLALAAYNAGPGNVKNGRVPPFAETRAYVDAVLSNWRRLAFGSRSVSIRSAETAVGGDIPKVMIARSGRAASVSVF